MKLLLCSNRPDVVRVSGKFDLLDRILPKLKRKGHRYFSLSFISNMHCPAILQRTPVHMLSVDDYSLLLPELM